MVTVTNESNEDYKKIGYVKKVFNIDKYDEPFKVAFYHPEYKEAFFASKELRLYGEHEDQPAVQRLRDQAKMHKM